MFRLIENVTMSTSRCRLSFLTRKICSVKGLWLFFVVASTFLIYFIFRDKLLENLLLDTYYDQEYDYEEMCLDEVDLDVQDPICRTESTSNGRGNEKPNGGTKGFLVKTEGCNIPDLDPFDPSVRKYIFKEDSVKCNEGVPALLHSNLTSIFVVKGVFHRYNISDDDLFVCRYKSFARRNIEAEERDVKLKFSKFQQEFKDSVSVQSEFIKVYCFYNGTQIYKDLFSFVPLKTKRNPQREKLNVLVIGLDGVSRLNFHRQMNKTRSILEGLGAVELLGYNKVADNTFPNLIPVLTGLSEEELVENCWPHKEANFDKCPFIWNSFRDNGFVTAFGEDAAWMGLFNYQRMGFLKQPTDYYWDHFNIASSRSIGNQYRLNLYQCMGPREDYMKLLEYINKFTQTMATSKRNYFGFFWQSSLSHDILNKLNLGDDNYSYFLQSLEQKGFLNKTAMIFMSDHGIRWGPIRRTYQGSLEERLPIIYVYLPPWYRKQFPMAFRNLLINKRRLTTHFDLHETLKDLLEPYKLNSKFLTDRSERSPRRSQSLFNEISTNRTCESAGITTHWCTCQNTISINVTSEDVQKAANFTVQHINGLLKNYDDCVELNLDTILDARFQTYREVTDDIRIKNDFYTLIMVTQPSNATFEVTVRKKYRKRTSKLEIVGTISRLNLYGNESACIDDFHLKLYCYCRNLL